MNCLVLPANQGALLVARDLLDAAVTATPGEGSPDEKAVHDFRVGIRRLRTWFRAFKKELSPAVTRRPRHQLRSIVHATNLGRDAAVQLEWLARRRRVAAKDRPVVDRLALELQRKLRPTEPKSTRAIERFRTLAAALSARLAAPPQSEPEERSFGRVLGKRITRHAEKLRHAMRKVESADDVTEAHKARIAAKRLRYLVEPAVRYSRHGKGLLRELKALQNDLGALHDAHVFQRSPLLSRSARVNTIKARLDDEVQRRYRRLRKRWSRKHMKKLDRRADALASRLEHSK